MEQILQAKLDNIALGDPGILTSEFIKNETIEKKYKLGIIPHVVDQGSDLLKDFSSSSDTCMLDIKASPLEFMRSVAACESIASSTLHGLIAADSLHIPNLWIKMSDKIFGEDFKYHDYYSVYGIQPQVHDLRSTSSSRITPEYVTDNYRINAKEIDAVKSNLTSAFTRFFNS